METEHVTESNTQVKETLEEVKHSDGKPLLVVEDSPDCSSPSSVASFSSNSSFEEYNDNEKGTTLSQHPAGTVSNSSQMKFPPPQAMGRPGEYDPNRIPISIFSSKPSNQADWSVASNESLFSIHMGNSSFSRDHVFFGKSGELPRLDDSQSNWSTSQPNLPPVMEMPTNEDNEGEDSHKSSTVVPGEGRENPVMEITAPSEAHPTPASNSPYFDVISPSERSLNSSSDQTSPAGRSLSNGSGNSHNSFAFPVLVSEGAKSSSSLNVVLEKPEEPESESPATLKDSVMKWFSCFWWPKCWCCC